MTHHAAAGRMGAYAKHSRHDPTPAITKANEAFMNSFEKKVDPEGILEPAERARRADAARSLHFQKMAYASAKKRRAS